MELVVLGLWLDLVILSIFSKLNHSPPAQLLSRIMPSVLNSCHFLQRKDWLRFVLTLSNIFLLVSEGKYIYMI